MSKGTTELEVINAEVAQVIEVAKNYAEGFKTSLNHAKGYGLLFGTALNQLKAIAPRGEFIPLQEQMFPDFSRQWLNKLMNFAEDKRLKCKVTLHLPDGQLLLDLPEKERDKLFAEVEEITKGKSIEEIALAVLKKKHKDKPKTDPNPGDEAKRKLETTLRELDQIERTYQILMTSKRLAVIPSERLEQFEEARITIGRHIAEITKHRKKNKTV